MLKSSYIKRQLDLIKLHIHQSYQCFFVFWSNCNAKDARKMCLASLEKNDARSSVCVLIIITIPPTAPYKSPSAKQYHHPVVNFQSSNHPSTLPDYLQKTRSADGITIQLSPSKKMQQKNNLNNAHSSTYSFFHNHGFSGKTTQKILGNDHDTGDTPKNSTEP